MYIVPVSQFAPVHPVGQLHVSGSTHSPPFRHPPVQIAEGIYKGCNKHIFTETAKNKCIQFWHKSDNGRRKIGGKGSSGSAVTKQEGKVAEVVFVGYVSWAV